MCGIAGIFGDTEGVDDGQRRIEAMLGALNHRGPDGEGVHCDLQRGIVLGHKRLAIIDLSENARQPMLDYDRNVALVFNGEIYNYRELRSEIDRTREVRSVSYTHLTLPTSDLV